MTTPQSLHHSLLRPCVIHILRAAGYHSTRPSVLDSLTDLAARYMFLLAQSTAAHASVNHTELDISVQDVRMAMQDCGAFAPETLLGDEEFKGEEDMRGVDAFLAWITGKANREIRRIAMEEATNDDYLRVLKKKQSTTTNEDTRYTGTVLGKSAESRVIKVEGGDVTSLKEWAARLKNPSESNTTSTLSSRRQSSALSSLEDMEEMIF